MIDKESFIKTTAQHQNIIYDMKKHRVFNIFIGQLSGDVLIGEYHDEWYGTYLNKERCEALSELFTDLANCFK